MRLLTGTSGYSVKEWMGHFYPEQLKPASEMLRYYARHFPTVEINNTFYRMPASAMLAQWSAQVPEQFRSRRRRRAGSSYTYAPPIRTSVTAFFERAMVLGPRAIFGALLFQLPPFLKKDLPRLQAFLDLLPSDTRIAFEFRNESWQDDEVYEALRRRGAMLCVTEHRRGRHAVRRDLRLGLRAPAPDPLRRRRPRRLGRTDRRKSRRANLRLFHARGRGVGDAVRATAEQAVDGARRRALLSTPGSCAPLPRPQPCPLSS